MSLAIQSFSAMNQSQLRFGAKKPKVQKVELPKNLKKVYPKSSFFNPFKWKVAPFLAGVGLLLAGGAVAGGALTCPVAQTSVETATTAVNSSFVNNWIGTISKETLGKSIAGLAGLAGFSSYFAGSRIDKAAKRPAQNLVKGLAILGKNGKVDTSNKVQLLKALNGAELREGGSNAEESIEFAKQVSDVQEVLIASKVGSAKKAKKLLGLA